MGKSIAYFEKCIQNIQELGTNDECMFSKLFFSVVIDGKRYDNLECTIKQTVGSDYEKDKLLEVILPAPFNIPINYLKFRDAASTYYRNLVGSSGRGIRVVNSSVKMYNSTFEMPQSFDISD